ncbi:MAG: GNAT family N-acetyltransferase [Gemmatimonadota bacterium]|jgi:GNAT superfamily N-acetyltransferase|nr:hypothetical protein [Gemmatimonadota bacterium]MDP6528900.1 GNAT family N-acetyltransferase [Gemmatimonadota bacterium]MDP6803261.1 GNAT family N-acetyltransferase [Gemmatimonadota bacterium]
MLRDFETRDYDDCVRIENLLYPGHGSSVERMRHTDLAKDERIRFRRWVWEEAGSPVGWCEYSQFMECHHPRKFSLAIRVAPQWQRRGIGSACYERLVEELRAFDPLKLGAVGKDDMPESMHFLERRGFVIGLRELQYSLDLSRFDPESHEDAISKLEESGLRLQTLREYEAECPDARVRMWEMEQAVSPDIPSNDEFTPVSFDSFAGMVFGHPNFDPDAWVVALDGDSPVGVTNLWDREGNDGINTGLTAVRREYRGRGIASAVKARSLAWAKARGYPWARTENEENNRGMIGINRRLGFEPMPTWLWYEKVV